MVRIVTRSELDRLGCDRDALLLYPKCHANAGTWTTYSKSTGTLIIRCRACERPFVEILLGGTTNDCSPVRSRHELDQNLSRLRASAAARAPARLVTGGK